MNKLSVCLLGLLASAGAMAADYSVGIVNAGTGFAGAGTGLNLYSITNKGVDLVKGSPYVLQLTVPSSGNLYEPVAVAISPVHDLVYVAYVGVPSLPILVQFKITPKGLVYQWRQELSTGDASLQGSSIATVSNYLLEKTYPGEGLWVHLLNRSGEEVVSDSGTDGADLVSGHVDPDGKFYYSCRFISPSYTGVGGPANAVAVFKLEKAVTIDSIPLLTSTDAVFVQSECK